MKKLMQMCALLMFVFFTSCGQNQTSEPKDTIKTEVKDIGPNLMVRNIKKGRNGTILIAGPNNASLGDVFRYDPSVRSGEKPFTHLTSHIGQYKFWDALEDRKGNLWLATTDSGVFLLNRQASDGETSLKHFTTRDGLADNRVMSVYEDKAGIIWFGTGNGLSRYDGQSFRSFKNPNPSTDYNGKNWNNDITTIIEDKTGKLWVGTRGAAFVYDGKTLTTPIHKGEPFLEVWGILEDTKGNIWLSGFNGFSGGRLPGGLYRYDPSTSLRTGGGTFTKVSERGAYAIIEDKKGNIWTTGAVNPANSTVQALTRYEAASLYGNKPIATEIRSGKIFLGLQEAKDGSIWFGDATGVYRYDGTTITDFYNKGGQKKYSIDTKQSAVIWKVYPVLGAWEGTTFLGDGSHTGDVDILKGELLIENRQLVGGVVVVDMKTIENFVDQRLFNKLPPFFDTRKFPVSSFTITKVETVSSGNTKVPNDGSVRVREGYVKVTGNLTIEGITKPVTFPAIMHFKDGMDGSVEMNGTVVIDRTAWGNDYGSIKRPDQSVDGATSDEVKFFIKIIAKKTR